MLPSRNSTGPTGTEPPAGDGGAGLGSGVGTGGGSWVIVLGIQSARVNYPVQPVTPAEWKEVCRMGGLDPAP